MLKRFVIPACTALTVFACVSPPAFDPPAGSYTASDASIEGVAEPQTIASVDSTFFGRNLPMLGRRFVSEDHGNAYPVAILHHDFWTERFGGRPDVIGREIEVDGVARTVVGIMPPGIDVPEGVVLWVPGAGPERGEPLLGPTAGTVHEYAHLEDEVDHLLAFLRGDAPLRRGVVADTVALHVAPEGGGESVALTGDALLDPSAGAPERLRHIVDLAVAERDCCRFPRFEVTAEPDLGPTRPRITGPPGTTEFLARGSPPETTDDSTPGRARWVRPSRQWRAAARRGRPWWKRGTWTPTPIW